MRIPKPESQSELIFSARVIKRRSIAPHHAAIKVVSGAARTRRWVVRECNVHEIDFTDAVQQWTELPIAKRMRLDFSYPDHKNPGLLGCVQNSDTDDEDITGDDDLILPASSASYSAGEAMTPLSLKMSRSSETESNFLSRHKSLAIFLKEKENCDRKRPNFGWQSLSSLLVDPAADDGEDRMLNLMAVTKGQTFDPLLTPVIFGVQPNRVPVSEETTITIYGQNLGENRGDIKNLFVCGMDCTDGIDHISSRKIMCRTKPYVSARGVLSLYTHSGGRSISTTFFDFYDPSYEPPTADASPHMYGNEHKILTLTENMRVYNDALLKENELLRKRVTRKWRICNWTKSLRLTQLCRYRVEKELNGLLDRLLKLVDYSAYSVLLFSTWVSLR